MSIRFQKMGEFIRGNGTKIVEYHIKRKEKVCTQCVRKLRIRRRKI